MWFCEVEVQHCIGMRMLKKSMDVEFGGDVLSFLEE